MKNSMQGMCLKPGDVWFNDDCEHLRAVWFWGAMPQLR